LQDNDKLVVLLVEDEALIRLGLAESFEDAGFVVLEAGDGVRALERLSEHPRVAAMVTDIDMPLMDGLALTGEVRRYFPGVHIVLMSGKTYLRDDALPTGIPFFEKPVNDSELVRFVRQLIGDQGQGS
jgi:CheY-like chemotaxis protein